MDGETGSTQLAWTPPYPASWVDRLQHWPAARRPPTWSIYLVAWLVVWPLVSGPVLLTGTPVPTYAFRVHAGFTPNVPACLAAIHYLDTAAGHAIDAFRPAMRADEPSFRRLESTATTMPARPIAVISLVGGALPVLFSPISFPAMRQFLLALSPVSILRDIGLVSTMKSATFGVFVFRTVRQPRVVSRIHRQHTLVSLFRLQCLYGLSSLTARTALALVIVGSVGYATVVPLGGGPRPATLPGAAVWPDPLATGVGYLVLSVGAAAVVFVSPLIGLQGILAREKRRLQAENDQRLERGLGDLHRLVDGGNLEDIDLLNDAISSLVTEREVIQKIPTWPWSRQAFGVLTTAVLSPIAVWLLRQLLGGGLLP